MSRILSIPWLLKTTLEALSDTSSSVSSSSSSIMTDITNTTTNNNNNNNNNSNNINKNNKKNNKLLERKTKTVQVVKVFPDEGILLINDGTHTINVILSPNCIENFYKTNYGQNISTLQYSIVKLEQWHLSTVAQCVGSIAFDLCKKSIVSLPLAINCSKISSLGAYDCTVIGPLIDVNQDFAIRERLKTSYLVVIRQLINCQFPKEGQLPDVNGQFTLPPRYSSSHQHKGKLEEQTQQTQQEFEEGEINENNHNLDSSNQLSYPLLLEHCLISDDQLKVLGIENSHFSDLTHTLTSNTTIIDTSTNTTTNNTINNNNTTNNNQNNHNNTITETQIEETEYSLQDNPFYTQTEVENTYDLDMELRLNTQENLDHLELSQNIHEQNKLFTSSFVTPTTSSIPLSSSLPSLTSTNNNVVENNFTNMSVPNTANSNADITKQYNINKINTLKTINTDSNQDVSNCTEIFSSNSSDFIPTNSLSLMTTNSNDTNTIDNRNNCADNSMISIVENSSDYNIVSVKNNDNNNNNHDSNHDNTHVDIHDQNKNNLNPIIVDNHTKQNTNNSDQILVNYPNFQELQMPELSHSQSELSNDFDISLFYNSDYYDHENINKNNNYIIPPSTPQKSLHHNNYQSNEKTTPSGITLIEFARDISYTPDLESFAIEFHAEDFTTQPQIYELDTYGNYISHDTYSKTHHQNQYQQQQQSQPFTNSDIFPSLWHPSNYVEDNHHDYSISPGPTYEFVGQTFLKKFTGIGFVKGEVLEFKSPYYKIAYNNGSFEDLEEHVLRFWIQVTKRMSDEEIVNKTEGFRKRKEIEDVTELFSSKKNIKVPDITITNDNDNNNDFRNKKKERLKKKTKTDITEPNSDDNITSTFPHFTDHTSSSPPRYTPFSIDPVMMSKHDKYITLNYPNNIPNYPFSTHHPLSTFNDHHPTATTNTAKIIPSFSSQNKPLPFPLPPSLPLSISIPQSSRVQPSFSPTSSFISSINQPPAVNPLVHKDTSQAAKTAIYALLGKN